VSDSQLNILR